MKKVYRYVISVLIMLLLFSNTVFAEAKADLSSANEKITIAINKANSQDFNSVKLLFDEFSAQWAIFEDDLKEDSIQTYGDIEEKMGMVQFLLNQDPIQKESLIEALQDLSNTNQSFINGEIEENNETNSNRNQSINDLLLMLQKSKKQAESNDIAGALKTMDEFSSVWLNVEGVVLTQSQEVYKSAESDMVTIKAYLKMGEDGKEEAIQTINSMYSYLTPLASKASYTMLDSITIILREGLEALLVVIALLAFLRKSGHQDKKNWIYGGVLAGIGVSVVIAVLVQLIFNSGSFGNNNFLISGYTGIFAAIMLVYMSYWLHSKSNVNQWQHYIKDKGTKALAKGSLFSLALLAFLAVFREGTEIVLFYIGMASSIALKDLLLGIGIGTVILAIIAILMLKLGMKIPIRPFFLVSSLLVFYLGLKFTGMGINSLQLAGIIPANTNSQLPSISWLGTYPSWEVIVPQLLIVMFAIGMIFRDFIAKKSNSLK